MFGLDKTLRSTVEKQHSKFYKILKSSLKPKNEHILIVSDYGTKTNTLAPMLGYGYYHAAKQKGFDVTLLFQEVKKGFMFADDHIIKAIQNLEKNNIIIVVVSSKIGRFGQGKSFRRFCKERGHRFLSATSLGDVNETYFDIFMETMNVSHTKMKKRAMKIKKMWDKAKTIRVKTEAGTDVTFDVEGMKAIINIGDYHERGSGGNMPAGEVYIPPKGYYGVHGKVVVDGSMRTEDGAILLTKPLVLYIEKGRVVRIEGENAHLLEKTFTKHEDRAKYPYRVRHAAELGVGINPSAVLIGSLILDEKVYGTGHIAMGSNYWFGGEIKTIYHGDQVFKKPIYYVDGERMEY
ncbi:hypothetical protein HOL21_02745 [Candidatus Woesearchaeota archaeon]|jgi:aminopeptidase|nr:hypothetical protein [Candidatus Woesearchaeota archaeon]MBT5397107.1 hypothetical protein [Candidatus Woesearchaeota archaeon]MBT5924761.1 hypothetical protein [Candidatus Woesearchaeota archaeon]MBT6367347.1 hypothetical protein [Candidatus Woesearchaeota archaeon]MBT7762507.1 hypothetical protein [Candidatus Woesearchaeota archaeon]